MSELPKGWTEATFDDILQTLQNGVGGKQNKESLGLPVSRIETIADESFDFSRIGFIEEFDKEKVKKHKLEDGDILFSHINSSIHLGKTAIFNGDKDLYHGINLLRIVVNSATTPRYFNYYCKYIRANGFFSSIAQHAVNQASINQKKLRKSPLVLAPLNEQIRIANKLDSLLAKVETTQKHLDKIPTFLKRFRQSVLAAAVSGELTKEWRENNNIKVDSVKKLLIEISRKRTLTLLEETEAGNKESTRILGKLKKHNFKTPPDEIPEGWKWASLIETVEKVVDCHNKTAPYINEGIFLIRTTDIRDGKITLDKAKFINQDTYDFWSKRCPPISGDLILTREAPMGEVGIVPQNTILCMGQRMMLLRPVHDHMINKYLLYYLMSPEAKRRMISDAVGTGVKHLRVGDVESLAIKVCSYEEQKQIVKRVEALFALADKVEQQYQTTKQRTDRLTQSILAKAFRGDLVPQDPNDEPASELLKRIKELKV